ncbi:MAG: disulfide bond formation protein B [Roseiarcus sp.]
MPRGDAFFPDTQVRSAALIGAVAAATLAGAWIFQAFGIVPCELCLKERIAYYGAVPLAAVVAYAAAGRARAVVVTPGLIGLALIFAANAGLGIYHSGVEWGVWKGPEDCAGVIAAAPKVADFLNQLQHIKVVRCDEVQIRVFGLSLANWNVVISAALAALAGRGAMLRR